MKPVINDPKTDNANCIEDLKKRINLSESKKKVNYEEGEEAKSRNEEYTNQLKLEIEKLKEKVAKSHVNWQNVEQPLKSLLLQNKKPHAIVDLLDQWLYDLCKQYNLVVHELKQNAEKISRLIAKEQELAKAKQNQRTAECCETNQELKRIQELENKFEKLQMKMSEAELVQKKYSSVKSILEDEILNLQKDINGLDESIAKAKSELPQLTAMAQNAIESNQAIETQLNQQEKLFHKQKQSWEKSLMMYNQLADEIQLSDASDDDKHGDANIPSSVEAYSFEESSSPATEAPSTTNQNENRAFLEQMKNKAGTDKKELTKFLEQNDTKGRLEELKIQLEEQITQLQEENDRMEFEFQLNFLSKEQNSDNFLEESQSKLALQRLRKYEILQMIEDHTKLIEVLHATLRQLCMKIVQGCKMPSGFTLSPSPDETIDLLMACTERVDLLVEQCRDYDRSSATKMYQGIKYNENVEEAQSVLKPKKKPQQLEEPVMAASKVKEEHKASNDQEILTRAMIKRQAKLMIDNHAKMHQKGPHGQKKTKSN